MGPDVGPPLIRIARRELDEIGAAFRQRIGGIRGKRGCGRWTFVCPWIHFDEVGQAGAGDALERTGSCMGDRLVLDRQELDEQVEDGWIARPAESLRQGNARSASAPAMQLSRWPALRREPQEDS